MSKNDSISGGGTIGTGLNSRSGLSAFKFQAASVLLVLFFSSPAWGGWTAQTSGTSQELHGVQFPVDAATGYAVGSGGVIRKATNGGTTWSGQSSGTSQRLENVHFPIDATTGYIVGNGGTILKTTDGGATWGSLTSGTSNNLHGDYFPTDSVTGYTVGSNGTILKTTDGGALLSLVKRSFLTDGTPITDSSVLPRGTLFQFLLYINNKGNAVSDVSVRDVLDSAFEYQTGALKINNATAECSAPVCTTGEEAAIYSGVSAVGASTDAVDGDTVSITGSTIDAGNQNVSNGQLNLSADRVWALLFTVRMR